MITIRVYLVNGRRFEYDVTTTEKAREHADAIVNRGWRTDDENDLIYFPPHQVLKVVIKGGKSASFYPTKKGEEIIGNK